jgi:hypothetical protein
VKNVTHTAPHRWIWKFEYWQCSRCEVVTYSKNSVSFTACAPRTPTAAREALAAEPLARDDER